MKRISHQVSNFPDKAWLFFRNCSIDQSAKISIYLKKEKADKGAKSAAS